MIKWRLSLNATWLILNQYFWNQEPLRGGWPVEKYLSETIYIGKINKQEFAIMMIDRNYGDGMNFFWLLKGDMPEWFLNQVVQVVVPFIWDALPHSSDRWLHIFCYGKLRFGQQTSLALSTILPSVVLIPKCIPLFSWCCYYYPFSVAS